MYALHIPTMHIFIECITHSPCRRLKRVADKTVTHRIQGVRASNEAGSTPQPRKGQDMNTQTTPSTSCEVEMDCAGAVAVSDALAKVAPAWTVTITPTPRAYLCRVVIPGAWSQEAILRCIIGAMAAWIEARHRADDMLLA